MSRSAPSISTESVKVIAESAGIANLHDDACKLLAEDLTSRLKSIVQDSARFMGHLKRKRMMIEDFDHALRVRNLEPLYGFTSPEFIPFRFASGGGRELFFLPENEVELNDVATQQLPKLPLEVAIKAHWLAVDGVQPTVPENPPPISKDIQRVESIDPLSKLTNSRGGGPKQPDQTVKHVETVRVKQLATHELSVEQQLYYKEITEACVGSDDARRAEALQSLASDPGLHQMLPRLCTFISEGVKVNVVQNNLAFLIYLIRMVKALLDNPTLYLEKYLHELIPSVSTCIVSRQLCTRPDVDNHWALRDFASRLMSQICKNFNTSTNNIQTRVVRMFSRALQNDKMPLASHYGAISGLAELGPEVVRTFVLPRIKNIGEKVRACLEEPSVTSVERKAAELIKQLIVRVVAAVLKNDRDPPDLVEEYRREYGYLGTFLASQVSRLRIQPTTAASTRTTLTVTQQPRLVQAGSRPTLVARQATTTSAGGQKYVILTTPRSSAPSTPTTPAQSPIIKFQPQSSGVMGKSGVQSPLAKVVVVTMAQQTGSSVAMTSSQAGILKAGKSVLNVSRPNTPDTSGME